MTRKFRSLLVIALIFSLVFPSQSYLAFAGAGPSADLTDINGSTGTVTATGLSFGDDVKVYDHDSKLLAEEKADASGEAILSFTFKHVEGELTVVARLNGIDTQIRSIPYSGIDLPEPSVELSRINGKVGTLKAAGFEENTVITVYDTFYVDSKEELAHKAADADGNVVLNITLPQNSGTLEVTETSNDTETKVTDLSYSLLSEPLNVIANAGDHSATVNWDEVSGAAGYMVYQYQSEEAPADSTEWAPVPQDGLLKTNSLEVVGLENGKPYVFAVKAFNSETVSEGVYSEFSEASASVTPNEDKYRVTASAGKGSATISWHTQTETVDGTFNVYVYQGEEGPADLGEWTELESSMTVPGDPIEVRYTAEKLTGGVPYVFTVEFISNNQDKIRYGNSNSVIPQVKEVYNYHQQEIDNEIWNLISTQEDLDHVGDDLSANYMLLNDISYKGSWYPIGADGEAAFTGKFDGKGYTIDSLNVKDPEFDLNYVGMFSSLYDAQIKNLTLKNVSIQSGRYVGALAGSAQESTIQNVKVSGSVQGYRHVGALVGSSEESTYINNTTEGYVDALVNEDSSVRNIGGLIGSSSKDTLRFNTASVKIKGHENTYALGGLIGVAFGGDIQQNSSNGQVSGNYLVGGFIGSLETDEFTNVSNNYTWSEIYVPANGELERFSGQVEAIGGFIGQIEALDVSDTDPAGFIVKNNYSANRITFSEDNPRSDEMSVGAFLGRYNSSSTTIRGFEQNFWNSDLQPLYLLESQSDYAVGIDSTSMRKPVTFTGWDFDKVWTLAPWFVNGYPILRPYQDIQIPLPQQQAAPKNVKAVTSKSGEASLTWDVSAGELSYEVYQFQGEYEPEDLSLWSKVEDDIREKSYTVTGLADGKPYVFAVKAVGLNGTSGFSKATSAVTPQAVKLQNPAFTKIEAGDGKVTLKWTAVPNAERYFIAVYQGDQKPLNIDKGWKSIVEEGTTATEYTVEKLENGKSYFFAVIAYNGKKIFSDGTITDYAIVPKKASASTTPTTPTTPTTGGGTTPVTTAPAAAPAPSTQTSIIKVDVQNGAVAKGAVVSTLDITRTKSADGKTKDELQLTAAKAKEVIEQLKAAGSKTAAIVLPDPSDEVSEWNLTVPTAASAALKQEGIALVIQNPNVRIDVPTSSLDGVSDDLYFHLVPVKSTSTSAEIQQRALSNPAIVSAANGSDITVLGRPMTIETNLQSRPVTLTLPLPAGTYTAADMQQIGIYIEHSDGTKQLVRGTASQLEDGQAGIQFIVNHFSTFTVVKVGGWANTLKA
ncbi:fibronectin type III domain-containing protein, partial [Saccharibacillus sp. CPCC 101409]|uniref:fibronectin type III domain-containing protein n=1 Tax=Saccharibacillus sp. CPCC 101409 TaxID=3058041 RepID=UPI002673E0D6